MAAAAVLVGLLPNERAHARYAVPPASAPAVAAAALASDNPSVALVLDALSNASHSNDVEFAIRRSQAPILRVRGVGRDLRLESPCCNVVLQASNGAGHLDLRGDARVTGRLGVQGGFVGLIDDFQSSNAAVPPTANALRSAFQTLSNMMVGGWLPLSNGGGGGAQAAEDATVTLPSVAAHTVSAVTWCNLVQDFRTPYAFRPPSAQALAEAYLQLSNLVVTTVETAQFMPASNANSNASGVASGFVGGAWLKSTVDGRDRVRFAPYGATSMDAHEFVFTPSNGAALRIGPDGAVSALRLHASSAGACNLAAGDATVTRSVTAGAYCNLPVAGPTSQGIVRALASDSNVPDASNAAASIAILNAVAATLNTRCAELQILATDAVFQTGIALDQASNALVEVRWPLLQRGYNQAGVPVGLWLSNVAPAQGVAALIQQSEGRGARLSATGAGATSAGTLEGVDCQLVLQSGAGAELVARADATVRIDGALAVTVAIAPSAVAASSVFLAGAPWCAPEQGATDDPAATAWISAPAYSPATGFPTVAPPTLTGPVVGAGSSDVSGEWLQLDFAAPGVYPSSFRIKGLAPAPPSAVRVLGTRDGGASWHELADASELTTAMLLAGTAVDATPDARQYAWPTVRLITTRVSAPQLDGVVAVDIFVVRGSATAPSAPEQDVALNVAAGALAVTRSAGGRVGIGTDAPTALLHIAASNPAAATRLLALGGSNRVITGSPSGLAVDMEAGATIDFRVGAAVAAKIEPDGLSASNVFARRLVSQHAPACIETPTGATVHGLSFGSNSGWWRLARIPLIGPWQGGASVSVRGKCGAGERPIVVDDVTVVASAGNVVTYASRVTNDGTMLFSQLLLTRDSNGALGVYFNQALPTGSNAVASVGAEFDVRVDGAAQAERAPLAEIPDGHTVVWDCLKDCTHLVDPMTHSAVARGGVYAGAVGAPVFAAAAPTPVVLSLMEPDLTRPSGDWYSVAPGAFSESNVRAMDLPVAAMVPGAGAYFLSRSNDSYRFEAAQPGAQGAASPPFTNLVFDAHDTAQTHYVVGDAVHLGGAVEVISPRADQAALRLRGPSSGLALRSAASQWLIEASNSALRVSALSNVSPLGSNLALGAPADLWRDVYVSGGVWAHDGAPRAHASNLAPASALAIARSLSPISSYTVADGSGNRRLGVDAATAFAAAPSLGASSCVDVGQLALVLVGCVQRLADRLDAALIP